MANNWYKMVKEEFPEQYERMQKFGRRSVSFSTAAPTGTVSQLTQTTGGMEPLYSLVPYYRKRKINHSDTSARVDFIDERGDRWQEFIVLHPQIIEWYKANVDFNNRDNDDYVPWSSEDVRERLNSFSKEHLLEVLKTSPWYNNTAEDIDWINRVEVQSIIQKYTSHSISSTINLPNDVTKEKIYEIYIKAWEMGLKGITIYRDGCRDGVLTKTAARKVESFPQCDAPKRPKELNGKLYLVRSRGTEYGVVVGLMEDKPYEVFAFHANDAIRSCADIEGKITKNSRGHYSFSNECFEIRKMELSTDHVDEAVLCRMVSMMLRHGAKAQYVVDQINKTTLTITSFGKAIARVLKSYVSDGTESGNCPQCEAGKLIYEEGCKKCKACGYTAC